MQRCGYLVAGLFLFALGIVLLYESRLGLTPWDVLNEGIAKHTPLSFGIANLVVALAVLAIALQLGASIGPGTVANAVLIGLFVDLLLLSDAVAELSETSLPARALMLAGGIGAIAVGSALYIGAAMGAGPRDSLMLVLARRGRRPLGLVRTAIEGAATGFGFLLGGTIGLGTIVFALAVGPAVEAAFRLVGRSPLSVRD